MLQLRSISGWSFVGHAAGEIGADLAPALSPVIGTQDDVAPVVEAFVIVARDDQRRIPVEPVGLVPRLFVAAEIQALTRAFVIAHDVAELRLGVDDVRVGPVDHGLEAVATQGEIPVGVA